MKSNIFFFGWVETNNKHFRLDMKENGVARWVIANTILASKFKEVSNYLNT